VICQRGLKGTGDLSWGGTAAILLPELRPQLLESAPDDPARRVGRLQERFYLTVQLLISSACGSERRGALLRFESHDLVEYVEDAIRSVGSAHP
jgi:hypothetical protein